jgi:glycosyltransferase involved in cell wall biosynthesis
MQSVLCVISDLDYGGAARQLTLLATYLPRDAFALRVCVLGCETAWTEALRQAGVAVEVLGWQRPFDLFPLLALRRALRSLRPAVVHAWGASALRALALIGGRGDARLIVSAPLYPGPSAAWADRWLLRRAPRVTAFTAGEAERYRRVGVPGDRVVVVTPAVAAEAPGGETAAETASVPPGARVLLGVGPLWPHKCFRDAVWALDILHYLYDDLKFVLVGDGPDRDAITAFSHSAELSGRVHFTGRVPEVTPWLRRADVVWVPGRGGGTCATLEAMAAGKPVVAGRTAGPADLVADGVSGYLVEPGDKTTLARQTRLLLDDPDRRRQFGEEGRRRAAGHTVERLVCTFTDLYAETTARAGRG